MGAEIIPGTRGLRCSLGERWDWGCGEGERDRGWCWTVGWEERGKQPRGGEDLPASSNGSGRGHAWGEDVAEAGEKATGCGNARGCCCFGGGRGAVCEDTERKAERDCDEYWRSARKVEKMKERTSASVRAGGGDERGGDAPAISMRLVMRLRNFSASSSSSKRKPNILDCREYVSGPAREHTDA